MIDWSSWLFDGLLAVGLLLLAWLAVISADLFRAILFFIAFGLFMALCWARLAAPDVALAEAAIGAGISGALLLDAYRALSAPTLVAAPALSRLPGLLALLLGGATGALSWAFWRLPPPVPALEELVQARLADSGVSNPVTAVLLNFRGYDTLLEAAVLLLALVGVWIINRQTPAPLESIPVGVTDSPLVDTLVRLVTPLAVLSGAYLLWAGAHQPGGAFQAGSVLAGAGALLLLSDRLRPTATPQALLILGLILGLVIFCGIALGVMADGSPLLRYPPAHAGLLILVIETALTISIALTLLLLVSGAGGLRWGPRR